MIKTGLIMCLSPHQPPPVAAPPPEGDRGGGTDNTSSNYIWIHTHWCVTAFVLGDGVSFVPSGFRESIRYRGENSCSESVRYPSIGYVVPGSDILVYQNAIRSKLHTGGAQPVRRLVLIAGVVGILMYSAVVSQQGIPAAAAPLSAGARAPAQSLEALQKSLEATGARLDEAVITGWAEAGSAGDRDAVAAALGWTGPVPSGESRAVAVRQGNGRQYVTVRWTLTGKAASQWQPAVRAVQKALEKEAGSPSMAVQLGATAPGGSLTELAGKALGALSATDRQPWSDRRAASVAGRTTLLPPGPFGVNVQVAARRDAAQALTRMWVAWPALLQEY